MGGASSKARVVQNITNHTVNQTDISSINSTTIETAVETLVKTAQDCQSSIDQSNSCDLDGAVFTGDSVVTSDQSSDAKTDLSCVQSSKAESVMGNAMVQAIAGKLDSLNGTSAASALTAAVASQASMGLGVGAATSSADVNNNITNDTFNQTKVKIENIFKNSLKNNFTSETVSKCMAKTSQSNKFSAANAKFLGPTAKVNCVQSNRASQVQECKQLSEAINKTLQQTAQELGFKIEQVNITKTESKAEGEATSKAVVSFFAGLGCGGGGSSTYSIICIVCCVIICCCIVAGGAMKGGGKSNRTDIMSDTINGMFASSDL